jgi:hypothetical protein|tara:strand:+ start:97 stop:567 length:471 start_codon:yes stop_codon:yes gene_type:complete
LKITKTQLKQIIKEEVSKVLSENQEPASDEELYADFLQEYPSVKQDWLDLVVRPSKVAGPRLGMIDGEDLHVVGDALADYFIPDTAHSSDEQLEAIYLASNAIAGAVTEHYTTARDTALGNAESESDAEVIAMDVFKELFNDVLAQTSDIENLNPM